MHAAGGLHGQAVCGHHSSGAAYRLLGRRAPELLGGAAVDLNADPQPADMFLRCG